jgi:serine/threonine protein kinase
MSDTLASPAAPRPPEPLSPLPPGAADGPAPDETLVPRPSAPAAPPEPVGTLLQPADAPPLLPPPAYVPAAVAVPGYEIIGEIGRGGMGVVYKARQTSLNRMVALKMVRAGGQADDGHHERFRAEAEVVARLAHPHIVQIYEIGEHAGRPYLALELVAGSTLAGKIAGTPQPLRAAAHLVELLARAVHFAHQCGVVHRDLKPANVLLAPPLDGGSSVADPDAAQVAALYGVPKITDFGLARRLEDESGNTCSGEILGTPSYMAPEQAAGQGFAAGPAADIWALGAILYDMLTGRPPFKGSTAVETINQVAGEDPVPPGRLRTRLPRDLELICLKCLEKDPHRRYDTAAGLADDLRRHLNGESVHVRPAPPHERAWRWSRRNPVPASLLLAITLGAGFGFWHLSTLSKSLVRSSAIDGARQQTETMEALNNYYTRVANHLSEAGVKGRHDWQHGPPDPDPDGRKIDPRKLTMPPPATLTIELGQQLGANDPDGVKVRLYSDAPFRYRTDGGPRDEFERTALERLRQNPDAPVTRFEEQDGRTVLRYATARVMKAACVKCHNEHPDSTRRDWKEGDVRGVLEIIRPLDHDEGRVHSGLRGTIFLVAGTGATLLGLSVVLLLLGNRRRDRRPVGPAAAGESHAPPTAVAAHEMTDTPPAARHPTPAPAAAPAPPPRRPVGGCQVVFGELPYTAAFDSDRASADEAVADS